VGFFIYRHLGLAWCNIAIMKRFIPLLLIIGFSCVPNVIPDAQESERKYSSLYFVEESNNEHIKLKNSYGSLITKVEGSTSAFMLFGVGDLVYVQRPWSEPSPEFYTLLNYGSKETCKISIVSILGHEKFGGKIRGEPSLHTYIDLNGQMTGSSFTNIKDSKYSYLLSGESESESEWFIRKQKRENNLKEIKKRENNLKEIINSFSLSEYQNDKNKIYNYKNLPHRSHSVLTKGPVEKAIKKYANDISRNSILLFYNGGVGFLGNSFIVTKDKFYFLISGFSKEPLSLKSIGNFNWRDDEHNVMILNIFDKDGRIIDDIMLLGYAHSIKRRTNLVDLLNSLVNGERVSTIEKKVAAWEAKQAEKLAAKEAKQAEKAAKKLAAKKAAEELRKKNNPTIKEIMDSWKGSHQSTLIKSWGPPDRTTSDGKGGNILIYNKGKGGSIITDNVQIPTTKLKGIIERPPYYEYDITTDNTYQRYRMFYVDDKGIIYYWKYQN
jgi:hypothetical protein